MTYSVELLNTARKQLASLPRKAQEQIKKAIDGLAEDPRPHGYKALKGPLKGYLRIDTGNYRVIYQAKDKLLLVIVVKVGDRKDVYRR